MNGPDGGREQGPEAGRTRARLSVAAHEVPLAIQWHEGMLLAPQHFQQLALRQDALFLYHAALLSPFHWGVRHLRIDPVHLVDGVLRVLELDAVMPDGLVVHSLPGDGPELTADLGPHLEAMKLRPVTVHLAVSARRRGLAAAGSDLSRYESVDGEAVADENTGEGDLRLPRLRPALRLLIEEEPAARFTSFPLARVVYRNETFELAPGFVPPLVRVTLDSRLGELALGVARRLREKAVFLADQVRSPSIAARPSQLLETRSQVHSLVAALPPFEAMLNSNHAHPYPLYLALCAVVGAVAGVGKSLVPPALPAYDHHDLFATFDAARAFIFQTLDEGILESFTGYAFVLKEGSFLLPFDRQWLGRDVVLGVRARDGASESEIAAWMESAVIASRPKMPALRAKRMGGAPRSRVDSDGDLVPSRGVSLFALTPAPEFVVPGELLEITNPDDLEGRRRPAEIVLYVRNPPR